MTKREAEQAVIRAAVRVVRDTQRGLWPKTSPLIRAVERLAKKRRPA